MIALGLFAAANIYPLFLGELPARFPPCSPRRWHWSRHWCRTCGLVLLGIILWKALNRSPSPEAPCLSWTFLVLVYTAPMTYYAAAGAPVAVETPVEPAPAQEDPATEQVPSETPVQPSGPDAPATTSRPLPHLPLPLKHPPPRNRKAHAGPPLKNRLPQRKRLLRPSPLPRTNPSPKSIAPDRTDPGRFFYGGAVPSPQKKFSSATPRFILLF